MTKRGLIALKFLSILIVSVAIILIYPYIGELYGKKEIYKKVMAAREIALIIDTLFAYPYDTTLFYEKDLTGLTVELSDEKVIVYDSRFIRRDLDPASAGYRFYTTGLDKTQAKLENPKKIRFEKTKNKLIIKKDET